MKKINKGIIVTVLILVIVILGFIIGLWAYEKSFTDSIKEYSSFYGFLAMVVVALITFFYFLATRELVEYTAKSVKATKDLEKKRENLRKYEITMDFIKEWQEDKKFLTTKRIDKKLILSGSRKDVSNSGKPEARNYLDEYTEFMGYFTMVRNCIDDNKIDKDYYFKILSKDIVSYFDKEHENNKDVFKIMAKKRHEQSLENIDKDFNKIYNDAKKLLDEKNEAIN